MDIHTFECHICDLMQRITQVGRDVWKIVYSRPPGQKNSKNDKNLVRQGIAGTGYRQAGRKADRSIWQDNPRQKTIHTWSHSSSRVVFLFRRVSWHYPGNVLVSDASLAALG